MTQIVKKVIVITLLLILSFFLFILLSLFLYTGETDLGAGFTIDEESPKMIYYWKDTTIVFIPPEVLSYYNTTERILAKQRPRRVDERVYPKFFEYPYGRDTVYYWYVDKNTKDQIGPLLYSEMEAFLEKKGIILMLNKLE